MHKYDKTHTSDIACRGNVNSLTWQWEPKHLIECLVGITCVVPIIEFLPCNGSNTHLSTHITLIDGMIHDVIVQMMGQLKQCLSTI